MGQHKRPVGRPVGSIKNKPLTPAEQAIKKLTHVLRGAARRGVRDRHRTVRSVPFNTKHEFYGTPLTELMHPAVPNLGAETESWFDAFMYPLIGGEGDQIADLTEVAGEDMGAFVKFGASVGERAVRLLWALGQAEGATPHYNHTSITVQHDGITFGIVDGVVKSRFCSGLACPCDPKTYLEESHDIQICDPVFCALWVEAHSKYRNEEKALVALLSSRPNFNFRSMLYSEPTIPTPSAAMIARLERMLTGKKDPILKLYTKLVPQWMTVGEFGKVFCPLASRPLHGLTDLAQQSCITKMYDFFHNNTKKNKKGLL